MADIDVKIIVDGVGEMKEIGDMGFHTSQTCIQKLTVRHYDNKTSGNPCQKSK